MFAEKYAMQDGERVPVTDHTALDDLLRGEESDPGSERNQLREEIFHKLLAYFFAGGFRPLVVTKRVLAVA
jgi:hypothetical protein